MERLFEKKGWKAKWVTLDVDASVVIFEKDNLELRWERSSNKCKICTIFRPTETEIEYMGYKTRYDTIFLGYIRSEEEYDCLAKMIF